VEQDEARTRLLDAAEELFYARGVQAVGMDEVRSRSGVSLKRLYQCFPSKDALVEEYLRRRDRRWRAELADHVAHRAAPGRESVLAVFDWLGRWFAEPAFRGCAFANSFGEFGDSAPAVAAVAREHLEALRRYLRTLADALPVESPSVLAEQLLVLVQGATTTAAITGRPDSAAHARAMAGAVINAAGHEA